VLDPDPPGIETECGGAPARVLGFGIGVPGPRADFDAMDHVRVYPGGVRFRLPLAGMSVFLYDLRRRRTMPDTTPPPASAPAVTRREVLKYAAAGAAAGALAPYLFASAKWRAVPRTVGSGEHEYEILHDWIAAPRGAAFGNTHGLTQDRSGRIYLCHTVHSSSSSSDAVCVYDDGGKFIESWGSEFRGGAHGLDLRDEDGEEFIYHSDTRRAVIVKTNLKGEVVWQKGAPDIPAYAEGKRYVPTNVAFAPDGGLFVGDGYGSSYVHKLDAKGEYVSTIAIPGSGEGQVSCPHGLWIDDRFDPPRLAVADRSNRRIQYFSLEGKHLGFVTAGMREPCHFKTRGELLLVPDLTSVVTLLDRENTVVAHLGDGAVDGGRSPLRARAREEFIDGRFICPHDAIFLHNGDILVAEWVEVGRVTRLRRVS